MNMKSIINLGRTFAGARSRVAAIVDKIKSAQQAALDAHRPSLRKAVNQANEAQAALASAITAAPELFEKPRTINVDGIRLGMRTSKRKLTCDDPDKVIELIKKKLPRTTDVWLRTVEEINWEALEALDNEQLAEIGVEVVPPDPNSVTIKPTDSAVDKLVAALLEDVETASKDLPA